MLILRRSRPFNLARSRARGNWLFLLAIALLTAVLCLVVIDHKRSTNADAVNDFVSGNYRFFENQDNIAPGAPRAATNTPATVDTSNPNFRMRLGLENHRTDISGEWQEQTDSGQEQWQRISGSSDGSVLAAIASDQSGYPSLDTLAISNDSGVSWDTYNIGSFCVDGRNGNAADVVVSADGSQMAIACGGYSGSMIIIVVDFNFLLGSLSVVTTYDGLPYTNFYETRLVASSDLSHMAFLTSNGGDIYLSTDSGSSWGQVSGIVYCTSSGYASFGSAYAIAMSGDGSTLLIGDTTLGGAIVEYDIAGGAGSSSCTVIGSDILSVDISDDASTWVAIDDNRHLWNNGTDTGLVGGDASGTTMSATVAISGDGMTVITSTVVYRLAFTAYNYINGESFSDAVSSGIIDATLSFDGSRAAVVTESVEYIYTYDYPPLAPVLQYAAKTASTCSTQTTGWTAVTSSSSIQWNINPSVTSGSLISGTANDPPASPGFPYIYQTYASSVSGVTVPNEIAPNNSGLWDFSLTVDSSVTSGSFCLRLTTDLRNSAIMPFATYNSYPEITVTIPVVSQTNYRFYDNANSLTPGNPRASQNTVANVGQPGVIGEDFRLRTGIVNETANSLTSATFTPSLQFSEKPVGHGGPVGGCEDASNWDDVTTSSDIAYKTNPGATSGAAISSYANDPTSPTSSWVYQTYVSSPSGFTVLNTIAPDAAALWDFSLVNLSALATTDYCFRIVDGGYELDEYDEYPEVTTSDDEYISISATPSISIGADIGKMSSGGGAANVSTNATNGFNLTMSTVPGPTYLVHTTNSSYTIPTLSSTFTPASPASSTYVNTLIGGASSFWGYRIDGLGGFGSGPTSQATNATTTSYSWARIAGSSAPDIIRNRNTPTDTTSLGGSNTPDGTTVWFGVGAASGQLHGTYQATIVYTAVAN